MHKKIVKIFGSIIFSLYLCNINQTPQDIVNIHPLNEYDYERIERNKDGEEPAGGIRR